MRAFNAAVRAVLVGLIVPGFYTAAACVVPPEHIRASLIIPMVLALFLIRKDFRTRWILKTQTPILAFCTVVTGLAATILCAHTTSQFVGSLLQTLELPKTPFAKLFSQIPAPDPYVLPILALILAPIFEELWYREITLKEALRGLNPVFATLLSSFLFASAHFQMFHEWNTLFVNFPAFFFMGVFLSILRLTYGLLFAVLAHAVNNALGLYAQVSFPSPILTHILTLALLAAFVCCVSRSTMKLRDAEREKSQE